MKKTVGIILSAMLVIAMTSTGCTGRKAIIENGISGYEDITSVMDVKFSVPTQFTQTATAITEISDDANLSQKATYLYKDGSKQFLLFNMEQIVVAAEYGTSFGFDKTQDKTEPLERSSIMGVWLSPENPKGFEYEEGRTDVAYKLIGTVKAQAVITTDIYNDYVGKMATISNGTTEWSVFIGAPGDDYESLNSGIRSTIDSVVRSLRPNSDAVQEQRYDISLGQEVDSVGNSESDGDVEVEVEEINETEATDESSSLGSSIEDISAEAATDVYEEAAEEASTEITDEIPETDGGEQLQEQEIEVATADSSEEVKEESQETSEEQTAEQAKESEEQQQESEEKSKGLNLNNQKKRDLDERMVYYTDIYSMLGIGHSAFAYSFNDNLEAETVVVKLLRVYMNDTANEMVKEYTTRAGTGYAIPPTGTRWEVAEYDVKYAEESLLPYVNVKMTGLDGKRLNHLGISYTTRTYDMFDKTTGSGTYMVYYAVPETCNDYVLVFGDGNVDNNITAAYFNVKKTK